MDLAKFKELADIFEREQRRGEYTAHQSKYDEGYGVAMRIAKNLLKECVEEIEEQHKVSIVVSNESSFERKILDLLDMLHANETLIANKYNPKGKVFFINNELILEVSYLNDYLGTDHTKIRNELMEIGVTKKFKNHRNKWVDYKQFKVSGTKLLGVVIPYGYLVKNQFITNEEGVLWTENTLKI